MSRLTLDFGTPSARAALETPPNESWVCNLRGFVSATFLCSKDGKHLTNFAQWRSQAHWEAFTRDPRGKDIGAAIRGANVTTGEGHGYHVAKIVMPGSRETNDD